MSKVSVPISNDYCPQTLFLYGTYKEDGTPDFGLFCWFSYYWDKELGIMACIGGDKLTKDRIRANKVFTANLVTEDLLPLADYMGCNNGYSNEKMKVPVKVEKAQMINAPLLSDSPCVFELEVDQIIPKDDGEVYLCKIKNYLMEEYLADKSMSVVESIEKAAPVRTTCETYFGWKGNALGGWGEPQNQLKK